MKLNQIKLFKEKTFLIKNNYLFSSSFILAWININTNKQEKLTKHPQNVTLKPVPSWNNAYVKKNLISLLGLGISTTSYDSDKCVSFHGTPQFHIFILIQRYYSIIPVMIINWMISMSTMQLRSKVWISFCYFNKVGWIQHIPTVNNFKK